MNTDYRIRVGFFRHLKTKKLEKRLGESGVLALLKLWGYATEFRPEGDLSGLSNEDLEPKRSSLKVQRQKQKRHQKQ
jgi:hypothetical protein